ncbi:threonine synthase [Limisalsivibrio acetivorans]|uniref:threonine synthase n=1 Tax=Limisalsivibrio acetivorans TaxID=1304888 RepID=UPI0003B78045|nr:pyridoxal-phosphate dependent enzyme [Limisalsivibrio acetivorans]
MDIRYICTECGSRYDIRPDLMVCPSCAQGQGADEPVRGILEVEAAWKADVDFDVFDLLPVSKEFFPSIPVGNTPLWQPANLRKETGFSNLFIKDDGLNPTFSFKDRASFLVSAFAASHGINEIALASTGNAGSSMAGVGAAAGQKVTLFLPETAPEAKIVQALQYGATVHKVKGNYDMAYDFSLEYSKIKGGMNRNTGYNPMTIEGKKTVSLELFKQMGRPDCVFVSAGDGCIVAGVIKGFKDLMQAGLIDLMPCVCAVQAENSDALTRASEKGMFDNLPASTVADSISVDIPRNGYHAVKLMSDYDGRFIRVSDAEILNAQHTMASRAGIFAEPAGAAAYAGFLKTIPELEKDARIAVISTGNGLKDIASALKGVEAPKESIKSLNDIL